MSRLPGDIPTIVEAKWDLGKLALALRLKADEMTDLAAEVDRISEEMWAARDRMFSQRERDREAAEASALGVGCGCQGAEGPCNACRLHGHAACGLHSVAGRDD